MKEECQADLDKAPGFPVSQQLGFAGHTGLACFECSIGCFEEFEERLGDHCDFAFQEFNTGFLN